VAGNGGWKRAGGDELHEPNTAAAIEPAAVGVAERQ